MAAQARVKKDSSKHLRVHPSIDHKKTLEGEKLFDYKHWKSVRDYMRPTNFNYIPLQHGLHITDIVKVGNVYKQRFTRNNMLAQVPVKSAYTPFYVFVDGFEFKSIRELLDCQEEWIESNWDQHLKPYAVSKIHVK